MPEPVTTFALGVFAGDCIANAIGNFVSDGTVGMGKLSVRKLARHVTGWTLPNNEHVGMALRRAQAEAILSTIEFYERWAASSPETELDREGRTFIVQAKKTVNQILKTAASFEGKLPLADDLAKVFEKVLAGRSLEDDKGYALIRFAEDQVLEELLSLLDAKTRSSMPESFEQFFRGRYEAASGWHNRFVAFSHDAFKEDANFRNIFTGALLAEIADGVDDLKAGQADIMSEFAQMKQLLANIPGAGKVDPAHLHPLFEAVKQEVPTENFEPAIRAAVEALLAKAQDKALPMNDPAAIAAAINAAREKLKELDTEGAMRVLEQEIDNQDSLRQSAIHGEIRLITELADIAAKSYQWNRAIEAWNKAAELDGTNPAFPGNAGDIHVHQGRLSAALDAYEAAKKACERTDSERDLSVSHERIGDVLRAQGDLAGALVAFQASLVIRKKLAAGDPSNSQWQRDLIVSHVKLAEVGDDPVSQYEKALAIARELKRTGRLAPSDDWIVSDLEIRLKVAQGE
ncbi:MAG: tetratricopeptide repeat protein [Rhizobiaceae bacterium]